MVWYSEWIWYNGFIYIWLLLNFITTVFCLYHAVIGISGFHKNRPYPESARKNRFAALIAARNEENVIANLIESIRLQEYPGELIDVIVIADNCTDHTADVAREAGAIVFERHNTRQVGKGFVLQFAFDRLLRERDIYDAYCIFDADNLVDRRFFEHMNRALNSGLQVAQGYRDMKNPTDSWIAGGHSLFYWMENRFYNAARSFLGLSATINGTGFMIAAPLVREIGYNTSTCTEDIEYSLQCVLAGRRVGWVPLAKVYDEQPISLQQSMRQRVRWTNGLIQCYKKYIGSFAKTIITDPTWLSIDMFMYLISFPVMLFGFLSVVLTFLLTVLHIFDPVGSLINLGLLLAGGLAGFWGIAVATVITEKKLTKKILFSVLMYPVFNLLWVVIYGICLFRKNIEWKPIVHVRNMSLSEVESKTRG